jgi:hypothetical protein
MKRNLLILAALIGVLFTSTFVIAKRKPPKRVESIMHKGVRYSASHDDMGCVSAYKSRAFMWWKQIYVVKYDLAFETDVQDVFITSLKIEDDKLIIENEKGYVYSLDPETLEVKVLKGSLIVETP